MIRKSFPEDYSKRAEVVGNRYYLNAGIPVPRFQKAASLFNLIALSYAPLFA